MEALIITGAICAGLGVMVGLWCGHRAAIAEGKAQVARMMRSRTLLDENLRSLEAARDAIPRGRA